MKALRVLGVLSLFCVVLSSCDWMYSKDKKSEKKKSSQSQSHKHSRRYDNS